MTAHEIIVKHKAMRVEFQRVMNLHNINIDSNVVDPWLSIERMEHIITLNHTSGRGTIPNWIKYFKAKHEQETNIVPN